MAFAHPSSVQAETKAPLRVSDQTRFIPEAPLNPPLPIEDLPQAQEKDDKVSSHQKGGRPSTPKSTLPDGVPLSTPNAKARQSVAEGATTEELAGGAQDEQLVALRAAEKVLFPESVTGIETSWSYDVPEAENEEARTLGLPLTLGSDAAGEGVSTADLAWL